MILFKNSKRHNAMNIFSGMLFSILLVAFISLFFISCKNNEILKRTEIQKGDFIGSIRETGELDAVNAYTIITPGKGRFRRFQIVEIIDHGTKVNKGDLVARLDPGSVMSYITEQKTKLEVEQANLNKLRVQQESNSKSLIAELNTTQANYNMKKLELEKFQFESDKKKKVKELEFKQAKIRLDNVKEKIELEKKIAANNLKIQKIKIQQREENIEKAMSARESLDLYSGINGIVQVREHWGTGQVLKLGDQVWRGMPLLSIPDVSQMKVKSTINETDISKVKVGQKVVIRLDAYPEKEFIGEVVDIGMLSRPKERDSKVKVFDVEIHINGSDPALKPGMTVSCEYIYADFKDVFFAANECVEVNQKGYYIYKRSGTGYEQQKVKVGARNASFTVLLGNYKKGTDLIPVAEIINGADNSK